MLYANHTLINKLMKNYLPSILKKKIPFLTLTLQREIYLWQDTPHAYVVSFQKLFL